MNDQDPIEHLNACSITARMTQQLLSKAVALIPQRQLIRCIHLAKQRESTRHESSLVLPFWCWRALTTQYPLTIHWSLVRWSAYDLSITCHKPKRHQVDDVHVNPTPFTSPRMVWECPLSAALNFDHSDETAGFDKLGRSGADHMVSSTKVTQVDTRGPILMYLGGRQIKEDYSTP